MSQNPPIIIPGLPAVITGSMTPDQVREFWFRWRDGTLKQLDAVEVLLGIEPRTAELRRAEKDAMAVEKMRRKRNGFIA
jgi:hypothetical protein